MKTIGSIIGTAALALCATASTTASAAVIGSLGTGGGSFLSLSSAGLSGVATLSGGSVYTSGQSFAAVPFGTVGSYLAAGAGAGPSAMLSFTTPVSYLSFLWGSPDLYNVLTVVSTDGAQPFSVTSLGFATTDGDQSKSQYVQFVSQGITRITGVIFSNLLPTTQDAFEIANFSITAVPEPSAMALVAAGLGVIGLVVRRRRRDE